MRKVDHTFTKVKSPQTNSISERFHKTIQQEFYNVVLRTKIYKIMDELEDDLDIWLQQYNLEIPISVEIVMETAMEYFEKNKHLAKIKIIGCNSTES